MSWQVERLLLFTSATPSEVAWAHPDVETAWCPGHVVEASTWTSVQQHQGALLLSDPSHAPHGNRLGRQRPSTSASNPPQRRGKRPRPPRATRHAPWQSSVAKARHGGARSLAPGGGPLPGGLPRGARRRAAVPRGRPASVCAGGGEVFGRLGGAEIETFTRLEIDSEDAVPARSCSISPYKPQTLEVNTFF